MKRRSVSQLEDSGMNTHRTAAILSLSAAVIFVGGCAETAGEREYNAGTGVTSGIDLDTGRVSMDWRNEETGDVRPLTGKVTKETEIFINGIGAELADVRLGDRVIVVVYRLPDDPRWIVTLAQIERPEQFVRDHSGSTNSTAAEESDGNG